MHSLYIILFSKFLGFWGFASIVASFHLSNDNSCSYDFGILWLHPQGYLL